MFLWWNTIHTSGCLVNPPHSVSTWQQLCQRGWGFPSLDAQWWPPHSWTREREKKTFSGGEWKPQWEARHSLSSPLLSALMSMKTPLNDFTTKNATHWYWQWWQEQRKLQHRDGILSHHSTFIYTVVLKDYYILYAMVFTLHSKGVSNNMAIPGYKDFSYRDK